MKRCGAAALAAAILSLCVLPQAVRASVPDCSAGASILVCADTGAVLCEHNADEPMLIASTTKIMTALVVLENAAPEDPVVISRESTLVEGSSMYLREGETYTVEQLLYGLMLCSGNDAADALARHVAGDISAFSDLMNAKARELGMISSSFQNPHGLDAEGHYSTARDLATLMCAAMALPEFVKIVSTRSYSLNGLTYVNHNKLLWQYEGMLGGKTGYTMAAGRILVTCARREGLTLVCVTIADPDDWNDHIALLDWGFETWCCEKISPRDQQLRLHVISGESGFVPLTETEDFYVFHARDAAVELKYELPRFVYAPVTEGAEAGALLVYVDGELTARCALAYAAGVAQAQGVRLSAWERFKLGWYRANRYGYNYYPYMFLTLGGN